MDQGLVDQGYSGSAFESYKWEDANVLDYRERYRVYFYRRSHEKLTVL